MSRQVKRHFRGDLVRSARAAAELTNEQLARQVDVTLRTVQRWQEGSSEPGGGQLLKLAHALNVAPDALYELKSEDEVAA